MVWPIPAQPLGGNKDVDGSKNALAFYSSTTRISFYKLLLSFLKRIKNSSVGKVQLNYLESRLRPCFG